MLLSLLPLRHLARTSVVTALVTVALHTVFLAPCAALGQATAATHTQQRVARLAERQAEKQAARTALASPDAAHRTAVIEQDSLALVALFDSTNGDAWIDKTNWLTGPVSTWAGVTVEGDRVTALALSFNLLSNALPEALGSLDRLEALDLSFNQLSGTLPAALGDLHSLALLSLSANDFTGPIPATLDSLATLETLDLSFNQLSDPLPDLGNLQELSYLDVSFNSNLAGEIPETLSNLEKLAFLGLSGNKLSGPLPSGLGNLNALQGLDVSLNQLSGPLPDALGNLTALESLRLSSNDFTGPLPTTLTNLSLLVDFQFDNTNLCVPADTSFEAWLNGIADVNGPTQSCMDTATDDVDEVPAAYGLAQNYPNPFNPTTVIEFTLPAAEPVTLTVFDMLGREVTTLADGVYPAGTHAVTFEARTLPSGPYFYRVRAGSFSQARRMLLVK